MTLLNKVMNICKCGCGTSLRKDNRTGYQKGHKPCPVCGTLVKGSGIECCSKSCSAKLHWQRNPDMAASRTWNADRYATREQNRDTWVKNLSESCKGRIPWNKDTHGLQTAWNKNLPAAQQPYYGKKHNSDYIKKVKKTNIERYGTENCWNLAKTSPRSKKEKLLENLLPGYCSNKCIGTYKPDYLNEETKHIIEVYGDYWHCNPNLFKEDFYHSQLKKTAKEKWQADEARVKYLESLGYRVTIVWESNLQEFIKTL
jgi:G:T-mismatch repair DNA endonuclease (very short patch repair protein)